MTSHQKLYVFIIKRLQLVIGLFYPNLMEREILVRGHTCSVFLTDVTDNEIIFK